MTTWFECKVRYDRMDENGLPKKVTETYLLDALSFTEAEERIVKEMEPFISGDFSVASVKKANIAELFHCSDGDRWFRCRVVFFVADMDKGIERKVASNMYVLANDITEAIENLKKCMQGTMSEYTVASITETMILDVFYSKNQQ